MAGVHGDKEVGVHVFFAQLGGAVGGAVVASAAQFGDGALVRALAHVPAAEAARGGTGGEIEHVVFHGVADNDLGHGGAADIAGANKDEVQALIRLAGVDMRCGHGV